MNETPPRTDSEKPSNPISRHELYNLVWEKPLTKVSMLFGISDKGLAKVCAKLNVPIPGRGYWRLLETARNPIKPPLPSDFKQEYAFIKRNVKEYITANADDPIVQVSSRLRSPHLLIAKTINFLH